MPNTVNAAAADDDDSDSNGKAFPLQALGRPLGFQEVEAP
jgi:hypothetical protein